MVVVRGQASPIVVMILASVIVILGLGLISYVVSIVSSQRAKASVQDFVYTIQTATITYPEKIVVNSSTADIYVGVLNNYGTTIAYYLLVVDPENYTVIPPSTVELLDPPGPVSTISISCSNVYVFIKGFISIYDASRGYSGTLCSLYQLRIQPISLTGRPALIHIGFSFKASPPRVVGVLLLVEVEGKYYEVSRLLVRLAA